MAQEDKPVAIDEFIAEQIKALEEFKANWIKNGESSPEDWPKEMPLGEWWEQFLMFGRGIIWLRLRIWSNAAWG